MIEGEYKMHKHKDKLHINCDRCRTDIGDFAVEDMQSLRENNEIFVLSGDGKPVADTTFTRQLTLCTKCTRELLQEFIEILGITENGLLHEKTKEEKLNES